MDRGAGRRIIVNADDLGLSTSVNTAIFNVFKAGNLNSATLMVAMPGTADAVSRLKDHSGLAVGLHFCITEGSPLIGPCTLCGEDGQFMDRSRLIRALYKGQVRTEDVAFEFRRQLERIIAFGITPTHVDSHQHVHMAPAVFKSMRPILEEYDLPLRVVDPPTIGVKNAMRWPQKALKQFLNKWFARSIRRNFSGPVNDALVSIHDLPFAGPYDARTYRELLASTPVGSTVEVMVHPYLLGDDVLSMYGDGIDRKMPFLKRCEAEYQALSGEPVFNAHEMIDYRHV